MEALPIPKSLKVYQLVRMTTTNAMHFSSVGTAPAGPGYIGIGFYYTQSEAEQNRTLEYLKAKDGEQFFVFELEFPNPIHNETR
jgi:hypothetical protein